MLPSPREHLSPKHQRLNLAALGALGHRISSGRCCHSVGSSDAERSADHTCDLHKAAENCCSRSELLPQFIVHTAIKSGPAGLAMSCGLLSGPVGGRSRSPPPAAQYPPAAHHTSAPFTSARMKGGHRMGSGPSRVNGICRHTPETAAGN